MKQVRKSNPYVYILNLQGKTDTEDITLGNQIEPFGEVLTANFNQGAIVVGLKVTPLLLSTKLLFR